MNKLQSLLDKIAAIVNKNNQILDATGGRFNVFKVIGVTTEETRLHSAFIAELLNVNGSHGLKDEPLKAFIKTCLDTEVGTEFGFQTTNSICKVEYSIETKTATTGGRIDIIVWNREKNRAIIIENKIYACDQENQMLRYHNHSKSYKDSRLVYLSLYGKNPSEFSMGRESFDYKPLSYKTHIINWLTECKQLAIDFPLVREAISHYINLIKQLTNTSSMDKMNKEIVTLVMQSPENMQNAFELDKALTDIKIETQWEFWEQLQKTLEKKGLKVKGEDYSKTVKYDKVEGYYKNQRNKYIHFGLWIEVYNREGITIHWGCVIQDNIYFGFTIEKDGKEGISNNEEIKVYRQIIKDCDELYKEDSENWLGWMYPSPLLDFRNFNSTEIFSLADRTTLEETTNQIAEKAFGDITYILKEINKIN